MCSSDLASALLYPELSADAHEVLRKLGFAEKPVNARDGRWFTVRIMPYRTLDDRIDGVVITFADITVAKTLEAQLREKHTLLEKHVAEQSRKTKQAKDSPREIGGGDARPVEYASGGAGHAAELIPRGKGQTAKVISRGKVPAETAEPERSADGAGELPASRKI